MKKLLELLFPWYYAKEQRVNKALDDVHRLESLYEDRLKHPVYTTIRSFSSVDDDKDFWRWAAGLVNTDEYRFLLFSLRENTIREMVGVSDAVKITELNARLNMLAIIDAYLHKGIEEHEAQVRGVAPVEARGTGLS